MNITMRQALAEAQDEGLARIDAQMLLLHTLGRVPHDRAWLLAHDDEPLPPEAWETFKTCCERRLAGEPIAYLVGHKAFYGLDLHINANVLDPRPDTETLVDWALEIAAPLTAPRIVDLGTGSGAIALALRAQRPDALVTAIDQSPEALEVARHNAALLGLPIQLQRGDWLQGLSERFDLIVGNPPYIAEGDPHLPALSQEPRMALTSGADGLEAIRRIIAQAPAQLLPGGWLLLEHGHDQADEVRALLSAQGFAHVQSRKDLAGIARCSGGTIPRNPADDGPKVK